ILLSRYHGRDDVVGIAEVAVAIYIKPDLFAESAAHVAELRNRGDGLRAQINIAYSLTHCFSQDEIPFGIKAESVGVIDECGRKWNCSARSISEWRGGHYIRRRLIGWSDSGESRDLTSRVDLADDTVLRVGDVDGIVGRDRNTAWLVEQTGGCRSV